MTFENNVAIITGAAREIGCATALAVVREGASVAVLDVDADPPVCLREAGKRLCYAAADVAREREVADAVAKVEQRFGGVDILVNNAGIQCYATVTRPPGKSGTTFSGATSRARFSAQSIPSRRSSGGGGVVVNVASVQSSVTQRRVAAYSTMKSAPLGLTCSIAIDYAPSVRYVAVCPGTVDTPMFRNALGQAGDPGALPEECIAMHPPKRIVSPAKVADLILFLSSTKATFITGLSVRIDGGLGIGGSIRPA